MRHEIIGDRLLVKVLETGERTKGGLFIPEIATDNTPWMKAEILGVGTGWVSMQSGLQIPLPNVKVGDVVIFFRTMQPGDQLVVPLGDGEEGLIIRYASILEILHDLNTGSTIVDADGKALVM
jgi:co-chaperonin GroES (HSP10)